MAKQKTLDDCIRGLLKEGMLVSLYFVAGINALKSKIDTMTDEQLYKEFCGLFDPKMIRNDVDYIFKTLNNFSKNENPQ